MIPPNLDGAWSIQRRNEAIFESIEGARSLRGQVRLLRLVSDFPYVKPFLWDRRRRRMLNWTADMPQDRDRVIEAAVENMDIKKLVFADQI
jgi:hypothetical protein